VLGAAIFMAAFWQQFQAGTVNQYLLKLSVTMIAWPLILAIAVNWWTQEKIEQKQE